MRVLFLADGYPPESLGGYETACWAIAEGLRSRGHEIRVMTNVAAASGPPHVIRRLHRMRDSPSLFQQACWEVADNRVLAETIRHFRPHVISSWRTSLLFPSLYLTLRRSGVPTVFNLHDIWLPDHLASHAELQRVWERPATGFPRRLAKALVRWGFRAYSPGFRGAISLADIGLDRTVFCSRYVLRQHEQAGVPLGETRVIYNGIDLELFHGSPLPDQEETSILFVGRLVHEKGAHLAIEAVARLLRAGHRVRLTVAGVPSHPWEYPASLRLLATELGIRDRVTFIDSIPHTELPPLYRAHHVLVFPSSKIEGFPMTLLEAMACGCAVVSTIRGGSAELLEDGVNCLTCPPDDATALADRVSLLLKDAPLRERLSRRGGGLVSERYGIATACAATEEYLESVLRSSDFRVE